MIRSVDTRGPAPALLAARASVLAAVALTTGAVSHASAGGLLPGPVPLLLLFLGVTGLAARLLARPASTARVVLLVVAGQALVHVALSTLAGHRGEPAAAAAPAPTGDPWSVTGVLDPDGRRVGSLLSQWEATRPSVPGAETAGSGGGPLQHLLDHLLGQGLPMVLTHLAAAAALGLWLAVGEQALWRLLHLAVARAQLATARTRALLAWVAALAGTRRPVRPLLADVADRRPPLERLTRRRVTRRGPPLLLAS